VIAKKGEVGLLAADEATADQAFQVEAAVVVAAVVAAVAVAWRGPARGETGRTCSAMGRGRVAGSS